MCTNGQENWFIDYAKQQNLAGVTMGNHIFNTSVNYSKHKTDIVQSELYMPGVSEPFYCEVLDYNKDQPRKVKDSYWLWQNHKSFK